MNKVKKFLKSTAGMVLIVTILIGVIVHLATGNFFTSYNISTPDQGSGFCYPCWIRTDHCAADRRY